MPPQRTPAGYALVTQPRRMAFYGLVHQLLPMASGATGDEDVFQTDGQSEFLITEQRATYQDGQDSVNFRIGSAVLMHETPIRLGIIGAGQFPNKLLIRGRKIPRSTSFALQAWDTKTVAGNDSMRVLHVGLKVYDRPFDGARAYLEANYYRHTANFFTGFGGVGPVPASGTLTFVTPLPGDADFDLSDITVLADSPLLTVQFMIGGENLLLSNRPIHGLLLGATAFNGAIPAGGTKLILPKPYRILGPNSIMATVSDLSAAQNRVQIIYGGLRCTPPRGVGGIIMPPELQDAELVNG